MSRKNKLKAALYFIFEYALSISIFILIWQVYVSISKVPTFILPEPIIVFSEFLELFSSGFVYPHIFTTLVEVVLGFVIGSFLGLILGYIFAKIDIIKTALMPYLIFIQTAPKIALVPLFIVWFGIGMVSKIVLISSMVVFPVMGATILGISSIPVDVVNLMKVLKASRWQIFSKVEIMYSMPMLFAGLKIGIVQAVIGAIVSEWMSGKEGLGFILTYASSTYDTPLLMAGIIVTILLGVISYELVEMIGSKLLYWHDSQKMKKN